MKLIFFLIGLVIIIEGIPYFAFPERMKKWFLRIQEISDSQLRIIGFFGIGLGLLLVYLFRP
jgi:uncharacterized protein YjeT (DUF2065 family)